jgi:transposase
MKQVKFTTDVAGVDIGKHWLDVVFYHAETHQRFPNTLAGIAELIARLRVLGVQRVGMEASGNYEREVREALKVEGFQVVVFQPLEVKTFARWRRIRLKSDKADARLIALATQAYEGVSARRDPEIIELAEILTVYEQASDLLATIKTQAALSQTKKRTLALLLHRVKARRDWLKRFDLLRSLPGVGQVVALALLIRMPELGQGNRMRVIVS